MLFFENDYGFGAHPRVLAHLAETNMEPLSGYGNDPVTERAAEKIKNACGCENGKVFFLTGGTQANMVVLDTLLQKYEGVVAADSGHVSVHEAGAIESTGHKVLTVPAQDGKLMPDALEGFIKTFYGDANRDHMVFPGAVYISHPSEYGTLYSLKELEQLSNICHEYKIPLFLDGARLGYGLAAETDVKLADIARLCDVFYIGGTKCGALCGEAVVFPKGNAPKQFVTMQKRRGALLAKGRLNACQFDALFTDGLYQEICAPAVRLAIRLREGLRTKGYRFAIESPTNQQFVIMEDEKLPSLREKVKFSFIEKYDAEHTVIRFATSWATTEEQVNELLALL